MKTSAPDMPPCLQTAQAIFTWGVLCLVATWKVIATRTDVEDDLTQADSDMSFAEFKQGMYSLSEDIVDLRVFRASVHSAVGLRTMPIPPQFNSSGDLATLIQNVPAWKPTTKKSTEGVLEWGDKKRVADHKPWDLCSFEKQRDASCSIDSVYTVQNSPRVVEGIVDEPHESQSGEKIAHFYELGSYCVIKSATLLTHSNTNASYIDIGALEDMWKRIYQTAHDGNEPSASVLPTKKEIIDFASSFGFISEQQLRMPSLLQADKSFDGIFKEREANKIIEERTLRQQGRELAPSDYTCDPQEVLKQSSFLTRLGCAEKSLRFYRLPNYFRAVLVACKIGNRYEPLLESKGCGLPRWCLHTKNPDNIEKMAFKKQLYPDMKMDRGIQYSMEFGIKRWTLSDHGSGIMTSPEAKFEIALEKYMQHALESEIAKQIRQTTCLAFWKYNVDIYGESVYIDSLADPLYGNPLPEKYRSSDDDHGCTVEIRTLRNYAGLGLGWESGASDKRLPNGVMLREASRRNFLAYFAEPDVFSHPLANHHAAGIAAATYAVAGVNLALVKDMKKNKQLKASSTGLAGVVKNVVINRHQTGGVVAWLNLQADADRQLQFDFGAVTVRSFMRDNLMLEALTSRSSRGSVEDDHGRDEELATDRLFEYWNDGNYRDGAEATGTYTDGEPKIAIAQSKKEATMRLFEFWWDEMKPAKLDKHFTWAMNSILYWDSFLMTCLDLLVYDLHVEMFVQENHTFTGLNPQPGFEVLHFFANYMQIDDCRETSDWVCAQLVVKNMLGVIERHAQAFKGSWANWPKRLDDRRLYDKDAKFWAIKFISALDKRTSLYVCDLICGPEDPSSVTDNSRPVSIQACELDHETRRVRIILRKLGQDFQADVTANPTEFALRWFVVDHVRYHLLAHPILTDREADKVVEKVKSSVGTLSARRQ